MTGIDWKAEAIQSLCNYRLNKRSIKNLRERIEILSSQLEGIRSPGGSERAGKGRERDEAYCDAITKRDNMRRQLELIEREVQLVESGLSALSDPERDILTAVYVNKSSILHICDDLHISQSTAYALRNRALKHFSSALFGCKK